MLGIQIMRIFLIFFILIITFVPFSYGQEEKGAMLNTLVITGGQDFEVSFYEIFESFDNISYDTVSQPEANRRLAAKTMDNYDVLVFYDMWQDIDENEKRGFMNLLQTGMGIIFLHHSLASYQNWDEFKMIIGGKYLLESDLELGIAASAYKHDLTLQVKILNKTHAITRNIGDFEIQDEGYQGIEILPSVQPILQVDHPDCAKYVAWNHTYNKSKIVYILLGHDHHAYQEQNFRKLIQNAIYFVADKSL
jgi:type 1 glutamine amidotransferase